MKRLVTFQFLIFFFCLNGISENYVTNIDILIKNQVDFNNMNNTLSETIRKLSEEKEQTINIIFSDGIYKFNNDNVIVLSDITKKGLVLNITSNNKDKVYIISDGNEYNIREANAKKTSTHYYLPVKSSYTKGEVYIDQNFSTIPTSDTGELTPSDMNQATTEISIVDSIKKIAKLGIPEELSYIKNKDADYFKNCIIYWKSWFITKYGTIDYSDNTYLYFNYDSDYLLNGDFSYVKKTPLFYITNISNRTNKNKVFIKDNLLYIPTDVDKLYELKYQKFIDFSNIHFKKITISNLTFCGSSLFNPIHSTAPLIRLESTDNVDIVNNIFKNLGNSTVINGTAKNLNYNTFSAKNFLLSDNKSSDLYGYLVNSTIENSTIKNNFIENSGIFYKGNSTILVSGKNYYIANNTIKNSAYIGIRVGSVRTANYKISGIIEFNEVYADKDYTDKYIRNTIMDGGGIYIFTHNDSTVCRYNIVHDIRGRQQYRGIFCDDGAYNVQLIGNLVYNVMDFTIDLRYVNTPVVKPPFYVCTNNIFTDNILIGKYRFQGNPSQSKSSQLGTNLIIGSGNYTNIISNVNTLKKDIIDSNATMKDNKVYINNKQELNNLNLPKFILDRLITK